MKEVQSHWISNKEVKISGDSTTDKIPDVTHVSKLATIRNNVTFQKKNYIANTARKKESITRTPTVSASLIKQPRKENWIKRMEDTIPKMVPKQTKLRNLHQRDPTPCRNDEDDDLGDDGNRTHLLN